MNKYISPPQHVLHVFDPNRKCRPHDEVEFIEGRYVDIVNTKNKDPNTLYFGISKKQLNILYSTKIYKIFNCSFYSPYSFLLILNLSKR